MYKMKQYIYALSLYSLHVLNLPIYNLILRFFDSPRDVYKHYLEYQGRTQSSTTPSMGWQSQPSYSILPCKKDIYM